MHNPLKFRANDFIIKEIDNIDEAKVDELGQQSNELIYASPR